MGIKIVRAYKKRLGSWNKGLKMSKEHREALSISHKNNPNQYWLGKKRSEETNQKISKALKGKPLKEEHKAKFKRGENHRCWKGGVSTINENARKSKEFIEWRILVYKRDNYTCKFCGKHGGRLNAHHIKPFHSFIEGRYDVDNGITMCIPCHSKLHAEEHYANNLNATRFGNN